MSVFIIHPIASSSFTYRFDISGGGARKERGKYVQDDASQKRHADRFDSGDIDEIGQSKLKNKTVYWVQSYDKHDSCNGWCQLRALEAGSSTAGGL